jgi:hypothetical protein
MLVLAPAVVPKSEMLEEKQKSLYIEKNKSRRAFTTKDTKENEGKQKAEEHLSRRRGERKVFGSERKNLYHEGHEGTRRKTKRR